jgi:NitT/TauT family transport system substrate-binding protein
MNMRKNKFLILAAAVSIGLAAYAACTKPAPLPQVTLRICIYPTQDFLPYFVMREQGFDKQNGLRFEEKSYPGGAAAIDDMAAGRLDVCPSVGTVPVLFAAARGLIPSTVLPVATNNLADRDHPGGGVVAAQSIQSWKDLQGKQIAVNAANSITGAAVIGRLKQEGVSNYSLVEIAISNMGLAVAGGNVAAASMNEPYITQSLLRGDGKLLDWVVGGPPLERVPFTMIVFTTRLQQQNPEAVKAFLRGHLQAVRWMSQNTKKARSILAKRLDLGQEVGEKINLLHWPLDARSSPDLLDAMQKTLVDVEILKATTPVSQLYNETLLNEVLAEKR